MRAADGRGMRYFRPVTIAAISRTSIYVAAARAIGAREPDLTVRNPDDLAERLLGDPAELDVDHPVVRALALSYDEAMAQPEVVNIVRMMMIRTRFIDAALGRAIANGATQVVILGAGFDSHAYRCRSLLERARVFEVDRPVTQALKRARVAAALGDVPQNLTYVSIDFQHDDLGTVLARHGCDVAQRTFFITSASIPLAAALCSTSFLAP
jgi:methyltransferase (TIGR00027 family)